MGDAVLRDFRPELKLHFVVFEVLHSVVCFAEVVKYSADGLRPISLSSEDRAESK